ncbi:hypothetical protein PCE1_004404 [Barthelona sp. PCE]
MASPGSFNYEAMSLELGFPRTQIVDMIWAGVGQEYLLMYRSTGQFTVYKFLPAHDNATLELEYEFDSFEYTDIKRIYFFTTEESNSPGVCKMDTNCVNCFRVSRVAGNDWRVDEIFGVSTQCMTTSVAAKYSQRVMSGDLYDSIVPYAFDAGFIAYKYGGLKVAWYHIVDDDIEEYSFTPSDYYRSSNIGNRMCVCYSDGDGSGNIGCDEGHWNSRDWTGETNFNSGNIVGYWSKTKAHHFILVEPTGTANRFKVGYRNTGDTCDASEMAAAALLEKTIDFGARPHCDLDPNSMKLVCFDGSSIFVCNTAVSSCTVKNLYFLQYPIVDVEIHRGGKLAVMTEALEENKGFLFIYKDGIDTANSEVVAYELGFYGKIRFSPDDEGVIIYCSTTHSSGTTTLYGIFYQVSPTIQIILYKTFSGDLKAVEVGPMGNLVYIITFYMTNSMLQSVQVADRPIPVGYAQGKFIYTQQHMNAQFGVVGVGTITSNDFADFQILPQLGVSFQAWGGDIWIGASYANTAYYASTVTHSYIFSKFSISGTTLSYSDQRVLVLDDWNYDDWYTPQIEFFSHCGYYDDRTYNFHCYVYCDICSYKLMVLEANSEATSGSTDSQFSSSDYKFGLDILDSNGMITFKETGARLYHADSYTNTPNWGAVYPEFGRNLRLKIICHKTNTLPMSADSSLLHFFYESSPILKSVSQSYPTMSINEELVSQTFFYCDSGVKDYLSVTCPDVSCLFTTIPGSLCEVVYRTEGFLQSFTMDIVGVPDIGSVSFVAGDQEKVTIRGANWGHNQFRHVIKVGYLDGAILNYVGVEVINHVSGAVFDVTVPYDCDARDLAFVRYVGTENTNITFPEQALIGSSPSFSASSTALGTQVSLIGNAVSIGCSLYMRCNDVDYDLFWSATTNGYRTKIGIYSGSKDSQVTCHVRAGYLKVSTGSFQFSLIGYTISVDPIDMYPTSVFVTSSFYKMANVNHGLSLAVAGIVYPLVIVDNTRAYANVTGHDGTSLQNVYLIKDGVMESTQSINVGRVAFTLEQPTSGCIQLSPTYTITVTSGWFTSGYSADIEGCATSMGPGEADNTFEVELKKSCLQFLSSAEITIVRDTDGESDSFTLDFCHVIDAVEKDSDSGQVLFTVHRNAAASALSSTANVYIKEVDSEKMHACVNVQRILNGLITSYKCDGGINICQPTWVVLSIDDVTTTAVFLDDVLNPTFVEMAESVPNQSNIFRIRIIGPPSCTYRYLHPSEGLKTCSYVGGLLILEPVLWDCASTRNVTIQVGTLSQSEIVAEQNHDLTIDPVILPLNGGTVTVNGRFFVINSQVSSVDIEHYDGEGSSLNWSPINNYIADITSVPSYFGSANITMTYCGQEHKFPVSYAKPVISKARCGTLSASGSDSFFYIEGTDLPNVFNHTGVDSDFTSNGEVSDAEGKAVLSSTSIKLPYFITDPPTDFFNIKVISGDLFSDEFPYYFACPAVETVIWDSLYSVAFVMLSSSSPSTSDVSDVKCMLQSGSSYVSVPFTIYAADVIELTRLNTCTPETSCKIIFNGILSSSGDEGIAFTVSEPVQTIEFEGTTLPSSAGSWAAEYTVGYTPTSWQASNCIVSIKYEGNYATIANTNYATGRVTTGTSSLVCFNATKTTIKTEYCIGTTCAETEIPKLIFVDPHVSTISRSGGTASLSFSFEAYPGAFRNFTFGNVIGVEGEAYKFTFGSMTENDPTAMLSVCGVSTEITPSFTDPVFYPVSCTHKGNEVMISGDSFFPVETPLTFDGPCFGSYTVLSWGITQIKVRFDDFDVNNGSSCSGSMQGVTVSDRYNGIVIPVCPFLHSVTINGDLLIIEGLNFGDLNDLLKISCEFSPAEEGEVVIPIICPVVDVPLVGYQKIQCPSFNADCSNKTCHVEDVTGASSLPKVADFVLEMIEVPDSLPSSKNMRVSSLPTQSCNEKYTLNGAITHFSTMGGKGLINPPIACSSSAMMELIYTYGAWSTVRYVPMDSYSVDLASLVVPVAMGDEHTFQFSSGSLLYRNPIINIDVDMFGVSHSVTSVDSDSITFTMNSYYKDTQKSLEIKACGVTIISTIVSPTGHSVTKQKMCYDAERVDAQTIIVKGDNLGESGSILAVDCGVHTCAVQSNTNNECEFLLILNSTPVVTIDVMLDRWGDLSDSFEMIACPIVDEATTTFSNVTLTGSNFVGDYSLIISGDEYSCETQSSTTIICDYVPTCSAVVDAELISTLGFTSVVDVIIDPPLNILGGSMTEEIRIKVLGYNASKGCSFDIFINGMQQEAGLVLDTNGYVTYSSSLPCANAINVNLVSGATTSNVVQFVFEFEVTSVPTLSSSGGVLVINGVFPTYASNPEVHWNGVLHSATFSAGNSDILITIPAGSGVYAVEIRVCGASVYDEIKYEEPTLTPSECLKSEMHNDYRIPSTGFGLNGTRVSVRVLDEYRTVGVRNVGESSIALDFGQLSTPTISNITLFVSVPGYEISAKINICPRVSSVLYIGSNTFTFEGEYFEIDYAEPIVKYESSARSGTCDAASCLSDGSCSVNCTIAPLCSQSPALIQFTYDSNAVALPYEYNFTMKHEVPSIAVDITIVVPTELSSCVLELTHSSLVVLCTTSGTPGEMMCPLLQMNCADSLEFALTVTTNAGITFNPLTVSRSVPTVVSIQEFIYGSSSQLILTVRHSVSDTLSYSYDSSDWSMAAISSSDSITLEADIDHPLSSGSGILIYLKYCNAEFQVTNSFSKPILDSTTMCIDDDPTVVSLSGSNFPIESELHNFQIISDRFVSIDSVSENQKLLYLSFGRYDPLIFTLMLKHRNDDDFKTDVLSLYNCPDYVNYRFNADFTIVTVTLKDINASHVYELQCVGYQSEEQLSGGSYLYNGQYEIAFNTPEICDPTSCTVVGNGSRATDAFVLNLTPKIKVIDSKLPIQSNSFIVQIYPLYCMRLSAKVNGEEISPASTKPNHVFSTADLPCSADFEFEFFLGSFAKITKTIGRSLSVSSKTLDTSGGSVLIAISANWNSYTMELATATFRGEAVTVIGTTNNAISISDLPAGVGVDHLLVVNLCGMTASQNFSYAPPILDSALNCVLSDPGVMQITGNFFGPGGLVDINLPFYRNVSGNVVDQDYIELTFFDSVPSLTNTTFYLTVTIGGQESARVTVRHCPRYSNFSTSVSNFITSLHGEFFLLTDKFVLTCPVVGIIGCTVATSDLIIVDQFDYTESISCNLTLSYNFQKFDIEVVLDQKPIISAYPSFFPENNGDILFTINKAVVEPEHTLIVDGISYTITKELDIDVYSLNVSELLCFGDLDGLVTVQVKTNSFYSEEIKIPRFDMQFYPINQTVMTEGEDIFVKGVFFSTGDGPITATVNASIVNVVHYSYDSVQVSVPPGSGTGIISLTHCNMTLSQTFRYTRPTLRQIQNCASENATIFMLQGSNFGTSTSNISFESSRGVSLLNHTHTNMTVMFDQFIGNHFYVTVTVDGQSSDLTNIFNCPVVEYVHPINNNTELTVSGRYFRESMKFSVNEDTVSWVSAFTVNCYGRNAYVNGTETMNCGPVDVLHHCGSIPGFNLTDAFGIVVLNEVIFLPPIIFVPPPHIPTFSGSAKMTVVGANKLCRPKLEYEGVQYSVSIISENTWEFVTGMIQCQPTNAIAVSLLKGLYVSSAEVIVPRADMMVFSQSSVTTEGGLVQIDGMYPISAIEHTTNKSLDMFGIEFSINFISRTSLTVNMLPGTGINAYALTICGHRTELEGFKFAAPVITTIDCFGSNQGDLYYIHGSNFGYNRSIVQLVTSRRYNILSVRHHTIKLQWEQNHHGDFLSITVKVDGQQSVEFVAKACIVVSDEELFSENTKVQFKAAHVFQPIHTLNCSNSTHEGIETSCAAFVSMLGTNFTSCFIPQSCDMLTCQLTAPQQVSNVFTLKPTPIIISVPVSLPKLGMLPYADAIIMNGVFDWCNVEYVFVNGDPHTAKALTRPLFDTFVFSDKTYPCELTIEVTVTGMSENISFSVPHTTMEWHSMGSVPSTGGFVNLVGQWPIQLVYPIIVRTNHTKELVKWSSVSDITNIVMEVDPLVGFFRTEIEYCKQIVSLVWNYELPVLDRSKIGCYTSEPSRMVFSGVNFGPSTMLVYMYATSFGWKNSAANTHTTVSFDFPVATQVSETVTLYFGEYENVVVGGISLRLCMPLILGVKPVNPPINSVFSLIGVNFGHVASNLIVKFGTAHLPVISNGHNNAQILMGSSVIAENLCVSHMGLPSNCMIVEPSSVGGPIPQYIFKDTTATLAFTVPAMGDEVVIDIHGTKFQCISDTKDITCIVNGLAVGEYEVCIGVGGVEYMTSTMLSVVSLSNTRYTFLDILTPILFTVVPQPEYPPVVMLNTRVVEVEFWSDSDEWKFDVRCSEQDMAEFCYGDSCVSVTIACLDTPTITPTAVIANVKGSQHVTVTFDESPDVQYTIDCEFTQSLPSTLVAQFVVEEDVAPSTCSIYYYRDSPLPLEFSVVSLIVSPAEARSDIPIDVCVLFSTTITVVYQGTGLYEKITHGPSNECTTITFPIIGEYFVFVESVEEISTGFICVASIDARPPVQLKMDSRFFVYGMTINFEAYVVGDFAEPITLLTNNGATVPFTEEEEYILEPYTYEPYLLDWFGSFNATPDFILAESSEEITVACHECSMNPGQHNIRVMYCGETLITSQLFDIRSFTVVVDAKSECFADVMRVQLFTMAGWINITNVDFRMVRLTSPLCDDTTEIPASIIPPDVPGFVKNLGDILDLPKGERCALKSEYSLLEAAGTPVIALFFVAAYDDSCLDCIPDLTFEGISMERSTCVQIPGYLSSKEHALCAFGLSSPRIINHVRVESELPFSNLEIWGLEQYDVVYLRAKNIPECRAVELCSFVIELECQNYFFTVVPCGDIVGLSMINEEFSYISAETIMFSVNRSFTEMGLIKVSVSHALFVITDEIYVNVTHAVASQIVFTTTHNNTASVVIAVAMDVLGRRIPLSNAWAMVNGTRFELISDSDIVGEYSFTISTCNKAPGYHSALVYSDSVSGNATFFVPQTGCKFEFTRLIQPAPFVISVTPMRGEHVVLAQEMPTVTKMIVGDKQCIPTIDALLPTFILTCPTLNAPPIDFWFNLTASFGVSHSIVVGLEAHPCPRSSTLIGEECVCDDGFYYPGEQPFRCEECSPGYLENGQCRSCPNGATAHFASFNGSDCVCVDGSAIINGTCTECSQLNLLCINGTVNGALPGFYRTDAFVAERCTLPTCLGPDDVRCQFNTEDYMCRKCVANTVRTPIGACISHEEVDDYVMSFVSCVVFAVLFYALGSKKNQRNNVRSLDVSVLVFTNVIICFSICVRTYFRSTYLTSDELTTLQFLPLYPYWTHSYLASSALTMFISLCFVCCFYSIWKRQARTLVLPLFLISGINETLLAPMAGFNITRPTLAVTTLVVFMLLFTAALYRTLFQRDAKLRSNLVFLISTPTLNFMAFLTSYFLLDVPGLAISFCAIIAGATVIIPHM